MSSEPLIFVIEEDAAQVRFLGTILKRAGCAIELATSRAGALKKVRGTMPSAFVLDLDLPAGDGLRFLETLRRDRKAGEIPVVGMLGSGSREAGLKANRLGVGLLLEKPVEARALIQAVSQVIGRELKPPPDAVKPTGKAGASDPKIAALVAARAAALESSCAEETAKPRGSVLLIDDDVAHLRPIRLGLVRAGYKVSTARNGSEGIDRLQELLPNIVVCDMDMPEMTGEDFLALAKTSPETEHIPVIILTGRRDYGTMARTYEMGTDLFLNKPVEIPELIASIEQILHPVDEEG